MKLVSIQLGQAIRLFPIAGSRGTLYGPNLARALEERYGFIQGPRTVDEWDMAKAGVSFFHGIFKDTVIEKFTIFQDGLVCETKANTSLADEFIDDAIIWARERAGFKLPDATTAHRAYLSRVDVQMNIVLDRAVNGFSQLAKGIADTLHSYGRIRPNNYSVAAVHLHVEGANGEIAPPPFLFERTINQPYSAGRYFSSAPLATEDHLRLLTELYEALTHL